MLFQVELDSWKIYGIMTSNQARASSMMAQQMECQPDHM